MIARQRLGALCEGWDSPESSRGYLTQLFATGDAHRTELSNPSLTEADMEDVAHDEAQKPVDAEVGAINLRIRKLQQEISTL